MNNPKNIRMTVLATAIAAACTLANAQDVTLYESHVLPEAVVFEPSSTLGMNSEIDIIVKGPNGFMTRQSFQAGEPIELNPATLAEGGLPDGTYRYELQIVDIKGVSARRDANGASDTVQDIAKPGFGSFAVLNGKLVSPDIEEAPYTGADAGTSVQAAVQPSAGDSDEQTRDQVINDDLIVSGSLCVGFDCVNGENFGFDTIRMKENNTRIKFDDTSSSGSFPNNDWQLTANDSANGGLNKFSIENTTVGRIPFTIEGPAPSNSLYVDDGGRIGFGTTTPAVQIHSVDGNTPTLRLQQDGSAGFQAQTWDVAGNEANFFIRNVTNGSALPFKIRPGAATDSLVIDAQGDVAIGAPNGDTKLHVRGSNGSTAITVEETSGTASDRTLLNLKNNGGSRIIFDDQSAADNDWVFSSTGSDKLRITKVGSGNTELEIDGAGDLAISGTLSQGSSRAIKTAIQSLDGVLLLENITRLDFSEWSYKSKPTSRHIGPMAEDFHSTFGLGSGEKHIAPGDMAGIAMAASKELALRNQELTTRIQKLEEEVQQVKALESELEQIRKALQNREN